MTLSSKWPWFSIVTITGVLFSLSCHIGIVLPENPTWTITTSAGTSHTQAGQQSITDVILGSSQIAIGQHFMEVADTYFHRGIEHFRSQKFQNTIFQRVLEKVSPTGHSHLAGSQIKEVMAWLAFAIRLNPHDLEAYILAGFWLADEMELLDAAIDVLKQGEKNNPSSFRIQLEMGRIYIQNGKLKAAEEAFRTGLSLWPSECPTDTMEARRGINSLLLYNGLFHEINNRNNEAINCYRRLLAMSPDESTLHDRLEMLEKGKQPSVLASSILNDTVIQSRQVTCDRDHEENKN